MRDPHSDERARAQQTIERIARLRANEDFQWYNAHLQDRLKKQELKVLTDNSLSPDALKIEQRVYQEILRQVNTLQEMETGARSVRGLGTVTEGD